MKKIDETGRKTILILCFAINIDRRTVFCHFLLVAETITLF